jgi:hypothetical protein
MKKIFVLIVIAIAASSAIFGQAKSKDNGNSVEAQITALEKAAWEAWKNKNSSWFQTNLAEDALLVNSDGVNNKSQIVKGISDCEIKSYSLNDFKFISLDKNSALVTFTAMQDGACRGVTLPSTVRASSVYVKRGGKWLSVFYTETPAVQ